jgi:hypothetical protein
MAKHRNLNVLWSWMFLEVDRSMTFRIIHFFLDFDRFLGSGTEFVKDFASSSASDWPIVIPWFWPSDRRPNEGETRRISLEGQYQYAYFWWQLHLSHLYIQIDDCLSLADSSIAIHTSLYHDRGRCSAFLRDCFSICRVQFSKTFVANCDVNIFWKSFHLLRCLSTERIAIWGG